MDNQSHNLTIPRGAALFAKFLPGTQTPGPLRDLGNCPEFTLNRTNEFLAHYSSKAGVRTKDAEISLSGDLGGSVVMDDISAENMAMWFMNTLQTVTVASATAQAETIQDVVQGGIYQLGRTALAPLGLRGISNLTFTPTGPVAGTDYDLDGVNGLLTIIEGGSIVDGTDLSITYDVAASTYQQVSAGDIAAEGELHFISQNPYGPNRRIVIPRVKIMPQGDLPLMTDPESPTWQQISFSLSVLKKGNLPLAINADGLPAIATA